MKKASSHLVPVLLVAFGAAIAQSCASGQTAPAGDGSGGDNGSGSGGSSNNGSGGSSTSGTGGRASSGGNTASSGGATSSGGRTSSGGTTGSSSGGTNGTATGGTTGTSTGGTTGTSTGGTTPTTGSGGTTGGGTAKAISFMGGFGMAAPWTGYAFTGSYGTSVSVTPTCPTPCFASTSTMACAMGSVPASSADGAFLGWNLGQPSTGGATPTVTTSGTGLAVQISGMPSSGLRVQIGDGTTTWCADLMGLSASIPWSTFNTLCYMPADPKAMAYRVGTPITNLQILVPGTANGAVSFNFCLVGASQY